MRTASISTPAPRSAGAYPARTVDPRSDGGSRVAEPRVAEPPRPGVRAPVDPVTAFGAALPPPSLLAGQALPRGADADPAVASPAAPPAPAAIEPQGETDPQAAADEASQAEEPVSDGAAQPDLTGEEQREVEQLQKRDREVRQHEQAHVAAAGPYAMGGPTYEYTTGPDRRRYATGGEVDIDSSKVPDDPAATIRKAQIVYRAALAPAEPSGEDRRVAAQAKGMEMEARQELARQGSGGVGRRPGASDGAGSEAAGSDGTSQDGAARPPTGDTTARAIDEAPTRPVLDVLA